jgi:two-component system, cell cycle response regulator
MDASILLIGDSTFRSALLDALLSLVQETEMAVEHVADCFEAMPLISAQQPDLLLIQASQSQSLELCQQVKAQNFLAWIYCVVIDDRLQTPGLLTSLDFDHPASLELRVMTLEAGADAYLPLLNQLSDQSDQAVSDQLDSAAGSRILLNRLFQAQIQVGLAHIRNHRELMRTNDLLSAIALSDPLTGLSNRRALEWELPPKIQNARSRSVPISLIMFDVDFFKVINDTHGHLVGDQVLKFLAERLRHNLRIYDTPFRYGGEEFVIILSNTDCQEAMRIANRICQLISEQPFRIDDTLALTVTISAGTATLITKDDSKGLNLLHRADQCLLQAKAQGRNRVVGCKTENYSD